MSADGIKERYGVASVIGSISYGGSASIDDGVITDDVATKPGKSDTDMYFKYSVSCSNFGINLDKNGFINSKLCYESIDKKNKTITLTQKFSW